VKDLRDRVAVVTGAASGIGLAIAHAFADEGMKLVLADIEQEPLAAAAVEIEAGGVDVLTVPTDVSSAAAVTQLADEAFGAFGNVHVVCNNAGVAATAASLRLRAWESSLSDWDWTLGVNFFGVLHGVRAFVPRMLENGDDGHIVNTASIAGLMTGANPYNVSKHAVVCLTEGLYKDFDEMESKLSASVVCPGFIDTQILDAERNRSDRGRKADLSAMRPEIQDFAVFFAEMLKNGYPPKVVADHVVNGIRDDRFYVFPAQPEALEMVDARLRALLERRNPESPVGASTESSGSSARRAL
jgi:NAD(P)-dependent dehydrogenase (short-subunit alcohol dehydrogenase family)